MQMTTLCYIENDEKYLMLHRVKKKEDINKNKWIGVGGHANEWESPEECLVREVKEETGLILTSYKFRGIVTFISDECESETMCLFTADKFTGNIIECDEGELKWVDKKVVPNLPTWEGDAIFLKLLVNDEKRFFSLKLVYEGDKLVENNIVLTIGSKESAEEVEKVGQELNKTIHVHLKIDTGFGRYGFIYTDREEMIKTIK